jgi:hypothetical protein
MQTCDRCGKESGCRVATFAPALGAIPAVEKNQSWATTLGAICAPHYVATSQQFVRLVP